MKKFFQNFYMAFIFLLLYAPIFVLMLFSFNDSKSRVVWHGFTLDWYKKLFNNLFSFVSRIICREVFTKLI